MKRGVIIKQVNSPKNVHFNDPRNVGRVQVTHRNTWSGSGRRKRVNHWQLGVEFPGIGEDSRPGPPTLTLLFE